MDKKKIEIVKDLKDLNWIEVKKRHVFFQPILTKSDEQLISSDLVKEQKKNIPMLPKFF